MAKLLCWIEQIEFFDPPYCDKPKTPNWGQRFLTIVLRGTRANVGCLILSAVYYVGFEDLFGVLDFSGVGADDPESSTGSG
jgi:hypothetical protein